jgi:hypothetical protein
LRYTSDIFNPVWIFRGRPIYSDLSNHSFTCEEKSHFINLEEYEKENVEGLSFRSKFDSYKIPRRSAREWKSKMISGAFFHPSRGRPLSLDSAGLLEVKDEFRKRKADNNPPDEGVYDRYHSSVCFAY